MSTLNDPPSIRRIDADRPDLFAVEITGHVSASDVENLYGLLEGAYALHDRIDLLVRVTDQDGVEWENVSPETVEDAHAHAKAHIARCATIGHDSVANRIAKIFSSSQAELRHFSLEDENEAWTWLGAVAL